MASTILIEIEFPVELHKVMIRIAKKEGMSVNMLAIMGLKKIMEDEKYKPLLYQPPRSVDWEEGCE